ncbi:hypothetical protein GH714_007769 [Hevea brasiliensis]|uniref:Uncharacterized protein n=1 Tax=Hevea brasiliensis TaxID=3981 RepID=A0A6A6KA86_HEVBR|nr:hypothetical protein GH714_007769 [Hevea brasiliensis]
MAAEYMQLEETWVLFVAARHWQELKKPSLEQPTQHFGGPPPEGFYELKTDAGLRNGDTAGMAMAIQDAQ